MTRARISHALAAAAVTIGAAGSAAGGGEPPDAGKLPFVLDQHLHVRRTVRGATLTLDDVVSGHSTLVSGDRLQLSIRTSQPGHLYLAFCSQHDTGPRYHGLSVFPSQGSIALTANVVQTIPSRANEIVLDNQPGRESIFIVVSKADLSRSDSRLADILGGAQQGAEEADCGSFRRAVTGPDGKPPAATPPPKLAPPLKSPPPPRPAPPPGKSARGSAALPVVTTHRPPPTATIERGVDIVLNPELLGAADDDASPATASSAVHATTAAMSGVDAGPDGIVVLRYDFVHVAPSAPTPSR